MTFLIKAGIFLMQCIYAVLKIFPCKNNRVLFLSRQSDVLSLDFVMLKNELLKQNKQISVIAICSRMDDTKKHLIRFCWHAFCSMYYLSTSSVCVIDAYWPTVSLLNHKKSLTIIQMWHALGKIKKSGYQTLGKESGRSKKTADLLQMHRNYDLVIAGGQAWNRYYEESFRVSADKIVNIGLPRIDFLIQKESENREKVLKIYPDFVHKTVILYAPTFRRNINSSASWEEFIEFIDFSKYVVIVKGHPNQQIKSNNKNILECSEFSAVELLAVCDFLVTDYSAIAIEGAILNKKTFYYLYDYDEYVQKNGLNVDPFDSMPSCTFRSGKKLADVLQSGYYDYAELEAYRKKYLPEELGTSTVKLAKIIISNLH